MLPRRFTSRWLWIGTLCVGLISASMGHVTAEESAMVSERERVASTITRPYKAEYELSRRGRSHGSAGRELSKTEKNGSPQWRYETFSRASLFILSDRRFNETYFRLHEGQVQPLSFEYERRGTGSNRHYSVIFDRENATLRPTNGDPVAAEWRDDLLDANAVLHQLQIDVALGKAETFEYHLIDDDGSLTTYEFAVDKRERIVVNNEQVETVRVSRVRDHDRRETYFWFAPEWNYTLVRMQQIEGGREAALISLKSLTFYD
ncbi:DUF3108 domain-containing protein [Aliidiomarina halalkaliphila]|uniref:DUF3108 domain-containing protein n=1 Tax=Aliidiomarina halalkaliphila TaxID=2593535 RepID=UPI00163D83AD|nr:DUF3108 domain-containing protein [Aliidiomarina halalkaliphila]